MLTATGNAAICVGYLPICTPSAVFSPPKPCAPMPSALILASNSFSISESVGSPLCSPTSLSSCSFAISIAFSAVPPMPTPTTIGGQGFAPASLTACTTAFFTPSTPSDGLSINSFDIFSLPKPFGKNVISNLSPSVNCTCTIAGVLSFVLTLVIGSSTLAR